MAWNNKMGLSEKKRKRKQTNKKICENEPEDNRQIYRLVWLLKLMALLARQCSLCVFINSFADIAQSTTWSDQICCTFHRCYSRPQLLIENLLTIITHFTGHSRVSCLSYSNIDLPLSRKLFKNIPGTCACPVHKISLNFRCQSSCQSGVFIRFDVW